MKPYDNFKDYYKILEINISANQEQIKKAHRKLALKYHPDRNFGNKTAETKFREIQEAYEVPCALVGVVTNKKL